MHTYSIPCMWIYIYREIYIYYMWKQVIFIGVKKKKHPKRRNKFNYLHI